MEYKFLITRPVNSDTVDGAYVDEFVTIVDTLDEVMTFLAQDFGGATLGFARVPYHAEPDRRD